MEKGTGSDEGSTVRARTAAAVVQPRRSFVATRAIVGGFLIACAAGLTFYSHQRASAEPATTYLVAARDVVSGTIIEDAAHAHELFDVVAVDLPPPLSGHALSAESVDELAGRVVHQMLKSGELVQAADIGAVDHFPHRHLVTLALAQSDALAGRLNPGQHVDVLATYTIAGEHFSAYVARDIPVVAVEMDDQTMGVREISLTLALSDPFQVQAVGHAARTAAVFLAQPGPHSGDGAIPPPYWLVMPDVDDFDVHDWAPGFDPDDPEFSTGIGQEPAPDEAPDTDVAPDTPVAPDTDIETEGELDSHDPPVGPEGSGFPSPFQPMSFSLLIDHDHTSLEHSGDLFANKGPLAVQIDPATVEVGR